MLSLDLDQVLTDALEPLFPAMEPLNMEAAMAGWTPQAMAENPEQAGLAMKTYIESRYDAPLAFASACRATLAVLDPLCFYTADAPFDPDRHDTICWSMRTLLETQLTSIAALTRCTLFESAWQRAILASDLVTILSGRIRSLIKQQQQHGAPAAA